MNIEIPETAGEEMYRLVTDLYPLCRSITGNGLRHTLEIVARYIPLEIHEVPSGTPVFDWTVPPEWNISDAFVKDSRGERLIDFRKSNLHVVGYSQPVRRWMPFAELKAHLFTLPEKPDWIPYRTSYYNEGWGFCLTYNQLMRFADHEQYEVCIDASLGDGHLTYGEYYLEGQTSDEVLVSCHACHPSLCNDNLSGVALVTFLAQHLTRVPSRRYSYRFLFIPGTIGSITWLSLNEASVARIRHGLVVACVGDRGRFTYKKSRDGRAEIDRAVEYVLRHTGASYDVIDFVPYGDDERQFCSPGFNLAVGCLSRTPHYQFPEYHTSADDLDLVQASSLGESLAVYAEVLDVLEANARYLNLNPKCEPMLGPRGLHRPVHGRNGSAGLAVLWILNLSDGRHTLLDIAERSGLAWRPLRHATEALLDQHLLKRCSDSP